MWREGLHSVIDPQSASRHLDRFGWLLILTYLSIAGHMLVDFEEQFSPQAQQVGLLFAQALATGMLLIALGACGVARPWRRAMTVLALIALGARTVITIAQLLGVVTIPAKAAAPWAAFVVTAVTFLLVCMRLTQHRGIAGSTLIGAVTAYLLIPVAFYYAFRIAGALQGQPFFGEPAPSSEYMFFSISTLTTLGYGEPSPATDLGQLLATSEALFGQLYLVVVVALIVGLLTSGWGRRRQ